MIKATFYCDIISTDNGEKIEADFDFDSFICETKQELEKYIFENEYFLGECIGYWGEDSQGILTEIFIDEDYQGEENNV